MHLKRLIRVQTRAAGFDTFEANPYCRWNSDALASDQDSRTYHSGTSSGLATTASLAKYAIYSPITAGKTILVGAEIYFFECCDWNNKHVDLHLELRKFELHAQSLVYFFEAQV
jgi:hypothetical protein